MASLRLAEGAAHLIDELFDGKTGIFTALKSVPALPADAGRFSSIEVLEDPEHAAVGLGVLDDDFTVSLDRDEERITARRSSSTCSSVMWMYLDKW